MTCQWKRQSNCVLPLLVMMVVHTRLLMIGRHELGLNGEDVERIREVKMSDTGDPPFKRLKDGNHITICVKRWDEE